jgi:CspA family cold shock protein
MLNSYGRLCTLKRKQAHWSNSDKEILRMADRLTGTIKWFNNAKGFGFIAQDNGEDVFVHFRSIQGEGYKTLDEGQEVEFTINVGPKGLQAEDVCKL